MKKYKGKIIFNGIEIKIEYYFINQDTIEYCYNNQKYITHYKSLIV